jgi:hypothetical protein
MPNFNMPKKEPCWPLTNQVLVKSNSSFLVYPNPANSILNIELIHFKSETSQLELYNVLGQLLRRGQIESNKKMQMDISTLSSGVYYLRCEGQVKKIIIECK